MEKTIYSVAAVLIHLHQLYLYLLKMSINLTFRLKFHMWAQ